MMVFQFSLHEVQGDHDDPQHNSVKRAASKQCSGNREDSNGFLFTRTENAKNKTNVMCLSVCGGT